MDERVRFCSDNSVYQAVFDTAVSRCRENLRDFGGTWVLIEGGGYHKIWLETQPMGGEMWAKHDIETAMNNQLMFMRYQREDGRLPGCIANEGGAVIPQYYQFQGFCFPFPALNMYYWTGMSDKDYLRQLQKTLEAFDAYLWRTRDSDGDGCLEAWCVFDTGDDNSSKYADAPNRHPDDTPPAGYKNVPMESLDVTSFSYSARETLAKISKILGDGKEAYWADQARQVRAVIRSRLWDDKIGACFDRDAGNEPIPALTHHGVRAMYWHSFEDDMAARYLHEHLLNPEEFFTKMPLPSIAVNSPYFKNDPHNNWSGPPQGLTYQRAVRAMENYGFYREVAVFGKKLLAAVGENCEFPQQFDPITGKTSVVMHGDTLQTGYGPCLLASLEYIARLCGVSLIEEELHFGAYEDAASSYAQEWNGHVYRAENDGSVMRAYQDDEELFDVSAGTRVITGHDGRPLKLICVADAPITIRLNSKEAQLEKMLRPNESIEL